jgi:hypothetical protein
MLTQTSQGDDGTTELNWRLDKASSKNGVKIVTEQEKKLSDEVKSSCCIYFPTRDTVVRSKGGIGVSGIVPLPKITCGVCSNFILLTLTVISSVAVRSACNPSGTMRQRFLGPFYATVGASEGVY